MTNGANSLIKALREEPPQKRLEKVFAKVSAIGGFTLRVGRRGESPMIQICINTIQGKSIEVECVDAGDVVEIAITGGDPPWKERLFDLLKSRGIRAVFK
ncbi:MAG: hypothetical protein NZM37_06230 [Sandaracinaceae bacterium]|nr:hypothetical protein [Sandaracinaceae bacterium]